MRSRLLALRGLLRFWPWALAVVAISLAVLSFDWKDVIPALSHMNGGAYLAVETPLLLGVFVVSAMRWMTVSGMAPRPGQFVPVYLYTTVAIVIGQTTPMQIGEALKIKFAQRSGLPIRQSAARLVIERLVDLAAIVDLAIAGLLQRYHVATAVILVAVVLPLGLLFLLPQALRLGRNWLAGSRLGSWVSQGEPKLTSLQLAAMIGLTMTKWLLTAWLWQFALRCVGCVIGTADCMLTVATVSVISLLSMVPGGLGVQELSLKAILVSLGNSPEVAETGSIAVRLLLPLMIVLGLLHLPGFLWQRAQGSQQGSP
jgi:uncharacterized membrane protein YbhN (UPF0104 family)